MRIEEKIIKMMKGNRDFFRFEDIGQKAGEDIDLEVNNRTMAGVINMENVLV